MIYIPSWLCSLCAEHQARSMGRIFFSLQPVNGFQHMNTPLFSFKILTPTLPHAGGIEYPYMYSRIHTDDTQHAE
jgi:hypothetical protein